MSILYNKEFHRWEVYCKNPVIRSGEKQPRFVSMEREKCEAYVKRVEAYK